MRDPAPSACAGGAFVFTETGRGSARTSSYHVPVLAETVRAWAEGSQRAVDGTVGGGGHAALLREAGADVTYEVVATGHGLTGDDLRLAAGWLAMRR